MAGKSDPLIEFFRGGGRDHAGRFLHDLRQMSHREFEFCHDFIQWLFPLPERSWANPRAPTLSPAAIDAFQQDHALRAELLRNFKVALAFYGLQVTAGSTIEVLETSRPVWLAPGSHHYLRISRILRCMRVLGLRSYAEALFRYLEELYGRESAVIGPRTFGFWKKRATEDDA